MVEPAGGIVGRTMTRRIWREGVWVAAGQVASALAGFASLKLLTTLLTVKDYGRFVLVFGLVVLGTGLVIGPILQAVLRFYPEAVVAGSVGALRRLSFDRIVKGAAILSVALIGGGLIWRLAISSTIPLAAYALAAAFIAADAVRGLEVSLLNGARRQRDQAIRSVADAFARPLLAVAALVALGAGPSQALLGYVVGSVLVSLALRNRTVRGEDAPSRGQDDPWIVANRGAFLSYALPLVPLAALNWVMSLGDRYVLAAITGASAVGTYAAAYALASQPIIAANALIHTTLRPVLYDAVASGDRAKERRVLRVWLAVAAALAASGTAAYIVLAPWLTRVVLGPMFGDVIPLLPWIACAYGFQAVQQTFEIMMYAHGQTRRLMALQAVAAVAAVIAYFVLIPRYGALGAAWGTLATIVVTSATGAVMASAPRRIMGTGGA